MKPTQDDEIQAFATQAEFEAWLDQHHQNTDRVWLKFPKKGTGISGLTYEEAVIAALCYGWIDGQAAGLDETYWLQRFTPRRPKSPWSKVNRERAEKLMEAGHMRPAGLREVERAQADGRWEAAYDGQATISVPDDLRQALAQNEAARQFFETLDRGNRFAILYRIQGAKKAETRARRIEKYVQMLAAGQKIY